jgi:hypothetical protein
MSNFEERVQILESTIVKKYDFEKTREEMGEDLEKNN